MDAKERNEALFSVLLGRKLVNYEIDYRSEKLALNFDSGVRFQLYLDEACHICFDLSREEKH